LELMDQVQLCLEPSKKAIIYVTGPKMCGEILLNKWWTGPQNSLFWLGQKTGGKNCLNQPKVWSPLFKIFGFNLKQNLCIPFQVPLGKAMQAFHYSCLIIR